jgi:hypothetical protein
MEKKEPKPQYIYLLSEKELQVLREYINENLKKKDTFDPRFYQHDIPFYSCLNQTGNYGYVSIIDSLTRLLLKIDTYYP